MKSAAKYFLGFFLLSIFALGFQQDAEAGRGACKYSRKQYLRICQDRPGGPAWPQTVRFKNGKSASFAPGKNRQVDPRLKGLLEALSSKVRSNHITITSAYRDCSYNHKVCGAVKSQHRLGNALDFQVAGYGSAQLQAIAKRIPGVGGSGVYCGSASHMDTGNKREWNWCKGGGKSYKRKKARRA